MRGEVRSAFAMTEPSPGGGSDPEEVAVCYLQVLLADAIPGFGRERMFQDMDAWEWAWSAGRISPLFFTSPSAVVNRFQIEWTEGRLKQEECLSCRGQGIEPRAETLSVGEFIALAQRLSK